MSLSPARCRPCSTRSARRRRAAPGARAWSSHAAARCRASARARTRSVLRVRPLAGVVHPTVLLFPQDQAWECDCGSEDDPCAHVAAAVIALRAAKKDGQPLPAAEAGSSGRVAYRFRSTPLGLALERVVIHAGGEAPLTGTLSALASRRVAGPPVSPSRARPHGRERARHAARGRAAARHPARAAPRARGTHGGVARRPRRSATSREPHRHRARGSATTRAASGSRVALRAGARARPRRRLRAVRGRDPRARAARGSAGASATSCSARAAASPPTKPRTLVADVLPSLASRMPVEIETSASRAAAREPPRLAIETTRAGDGLSVLATLVYGDPPCARIDAGRLVHLAGPIPLRDEGAESRLVTRLRAALGLAPGHRVELAPEAAIAFVERLERFGAAVSGDAHRAFRLAAPLEPALEVRGDGFTLRFRSRGEGADREADSAAVLAAFRRGEPLVPLLGGGFAPLPADWLARFAGPLADLLAARAPPAACRPALLPDLARLCALLDQPPPPGFERLAALARGDWPETPLPADLRAELRPYQKRRRALARLPRQRRARRAARRRHGPRQDPAGARGAPRAHARRRADQRARQLAGRDRALPARARDERLPRRRPQPRRERHVTLTTYAHPAPRPGRARRGGLGHARARRGAGDQEPGEPGGAGGLRAARRAPHHADRHAGREPPRRAVEPVALPEPRPPRRAQRLRRALRGADRRRRRARWPSACASASGRSCCAAARPRSRPSCRRAPSWCCTPSSRPRSARSTTRVAAATRAEVVEQLAGGGGVLAALEALLRLRQAALPPAPRSRARRSTSRPSSSCSWIASTTCAAEGHKALVFSQWTSLLDLVEPRLAAAGLALRAPRRLHARPRRRGRALPGRRRARRCS